VRCTYGLALVGLELIPTRKKSDTKSLFFHSGIRDRVIELGRFFLYDEYMNLRPSGPLHEKAPIIVLLGHTVLIESIAISLEMLPNLCVCRIDGPGKDLAERLRSIMPELVIFELEASGSSILLDILKKPTGIPLLGLDQNCSQVIVLNSYPHMTRTMSEFIQIVQDIVREGAIPSKGGNLIRIDEKSSG
jgi:hypothetical protein